MRIFVIVVCAAAFISAAEGQQPTTSSSATPQMAVRHVDASQMYQRVYAIVPIIGTGTWDDPKRPMFTPTPQSMTPGNRSGIIAFNQVTSDDGNFALVEVVTATKTDLATALAPISAALSQVAGVQLFQQGSSSPAQVQTAFQALKKNFDITKFHVVVP